MGLGCCVFGLGVGGGGGVLRLNGFSSGWEKIKIKNASPLCMGSACVWIPPDIFLSPKDTQNTYGGLLRMRIE